MGRSPLETHLTWFLSAATSLPDTIRLGPPEPHPTHPEQDLTGWEPPPWLRTIYRSYHGIGPWFGHRIGWGAHALLPWDHVEPLTRHVRFGEENIPFDPADAALLMPDGARGGVVLHGRTEFVLRRFDGDTHRLGEPIDVRTFLDESLHAWVRLATLSPEDRR